MLQVNVTELRQNLQLYLGKVERGEPIQITVHGRVIARLMPEVDRAAEARARLEALRPRCTIDDVVSPLDEQWNADHGGL